MNLGWQIFMIILIIILFILLGWLGISFIWRKEDIDDNPFILNFMSWLSDGYFAGIETNVTKGKKGRLRVNYVPWDINPNEIDDINLVDIPPIIVDKNNTIHLPKGTLSKRKNIKIYLPPSPKDFPQEIQNTEFGKMLMFYTAIKSADNAQIDALQEGMSRVVQHMEDMGAGEVSVSKMTQMKELYDDMLTSAKKSSERDINKFRGFGGVNPTGK